MPVWLFRKLIVHVSCLLSQTPSFFCLLSSLSLSFSSSCIVNMAPSAVWTTKEEASLIAFLVDHKAEAGDGGSFKATTFQKAAKHLAPMLKCGAAKNAKSCSNKYGAVCYFPDKLLTPHY